MYAVIKTGGKQYRVAQDDLLQIEKVSADVGDIVEFGEVLMVGGNGTAEVGAPTVSGASVAAEVVEQGRGAKVIVFKKRRRQNSRRKNGHRQHLTTVRVTEILTGGAKPSKAAKGKSATGKSATSKSDTGPADDVSLIDGIGPKIMEKLAEAGVTKLSQIAGLSEAAAAELDEKLDLKGRIVREEWVEQAKELLAGKPPRAKSDRARAEGGE